MFFVLKKNWKKLFRPKKNNFFENFWFFCGRFFFVSENFFEKIFFVGKKFFKKNFFVGDFFFFLCWSIVFFLLMTNFQGHTWPSCIFFVAPGLQVNMM